ncbi:DUF2461 domain-containing protein [Chelativorans salis]|uniref:DUF2461 domain-containing protein n=1 Tax=Chelativorans salis TaxID=2978478 RepID=A0ABT2LPE0_9HYPH|nr:DUF2461 domain-containing protein [Chelativorans sp. EGI FJ00035]MCT7375702.1 DUF2461 domain-containing protein [Chelativorans sp. EGI FJ00035]
MKADGFSHFPAETLEFLVALRANNDRDWFAQNKAAYERAVKRPAEDFCRAITARLDELSGLPHRPKIFRIHRDIRFSRDKTPYNTHLHISFTPDTDAGHRPGWYFGLEPELLTVGTGVFEFKNADLDAFRARVAGEDGERLATLIEDFPVGIRLSKPELKRVPQPYPADHPRAELLRRKSLAGWVDFADPSKACESGFADRCFDAFVRLKPLFDWLNAESH